MRCFYETSVPVPAVLGGLEVFLPEMVHAGGGLFSCLLSLEMKGLCPPQVSSAFQKKVQSKIKDLLQQMEEGLKTADPHDFSTYTGWTGLSPVLPPLGSVTTAAPPGVHGLLSLTSSLCSRHRSAVPAAAPGVPGGPAPAEGAGLREEGHAGAERS